MRKLNNLSASIHKSLKLNKQNNGKGIFLPELIDIICPALIHGEG